MVRSTGSLLSTALMAFRTPLRKKISNIIDGDGGITTGSGDWRKAGKVRRYQGTHASILEVCLASI